LCKQNDKTMIKETLDKTNLNWGVRSETITTESGIVLDGYKALVRDDNNTALSVMSDSYEPFQNYDLVELLDKVSNKTGLEVAKGGSFKDGARVYIQLKSDNLKLGDDRIEGYLTGINSFDGSTSLAFGPSNITISCMNSFFAAFREMNTKIRHTKNMMIKVDEVCRSLENALVEEKKMFDSIVQLSDMRYDDLMKDDVVRKLFDIKKDIDLKDLDSIHPTTRNKINRFYVDLNGELQQKGDNMWGLFSGVTKYTTHSLGKKDSLETKMMGVYGKREREIFNNMLELA
jgi:Domain of unknown function (DUF932)